VDKQTESADDIPFYNLLKQVKIDQVEKPDKKALDASKGTSSSKTDSSKVDTSESALSESKTSTSSQHSAPDDFVMVELVSIIYLWYSIFKIILKLTIWHWTLIDLIRNWLLMEKPSLARGTNKD